MTDLIQIYKWRTFCNTENTFVYSWAVQAPTQCVNNSSHEINLNSINNILTVGSQDVKITNEYKDNLDTSRVVEQTVIIDLKSFRGLTSNNITSVVGTGSVTATAESTSEIKCSISNTTDEVKIRSSKRGYYISGLVSEVGIAIRIPVQLDTASSFKFGYFDDNNGYYFKFVGGTLNCGIMYNGSETLISRSNFNTYMLDGTEENGITLNFSKGNIFRIDFSWYGFGQVVFGIIQADAANKQKFFPMHKYNTNSNTSCGNPALPINCELKSNGSALTRDVYIAGRQYSILGKVIPNFIRNMYNIDNKSSLNTSQNPLFSLKYRTNYKTCGVSLARIRGISNVNIKLRLIKNATLNGYSFNNITEVLESCLQVDTDASFTAGNVCKTYLLFAGEAFDIDIKDVDIYEDDTLTFTWQSSSQTNNISLEVQWDEKW